MSRSPRPRSSSRDPSLGALVAAALLAFALAGCGSDYGNVLGGELIPGTPTDPPPATTAPPTPP